MAYWLPEQKWKGQDAFIIGGGSSLANFDWNLLIGKNTIGCNDAYILGEVICGWCHFGDYLWFQKHAERFGTYTGLKTTTVFEMLNNTDGVNVMRKYKHGLHCDGLGWNCNTGIGALNLALLCGVKRVWLLGFDRQFGKEGQPNWHINECDKVLASHYELYLKNDAQVLRDWKAKFSEAEIFNTNPESKMDGFPKVDWRDKPWQ